MEVDLSTGILIDKDGIHRDSDSILLMMPFLSFPWNILGMLALLVPVFIRDFCYKIFARNRGDIWKGVKKVTGMGDTMMHEYRGSILGLPEKEPMPPSWGFGDQETSSS
mmetsp:Transcript_43545/g.64615  ORF Transcript_43545/g.64615 Transcript_43545/m.64615 type:complete len:109 (-) Transcript_43545:201-527(-)